MAQFVKKMFKKHPIPIAVLVLMVVIITGAAISWFTERAQVKEAKEYEAAMSEQAYNDKVARYDQWIKEQQTVLSTLNKESEALIAKDKMMDQKIHNLEQELGLTKEEFEKRYPGFDMDGIYE